jgi:threonine dehydratase
VLSGGNIDPLLLGKVIQHGMAAAGRYLNLRLRIPDRPGGLAKLLGELGDAGANVIEVSPRRIDADLSLDEVEVHLQLETRGEAQAELVWPAARRLRIFESGTFRPEAGADDRRDRRRRCGKAYALNGRR